MVGGVPGTPEQWSKWGASATPDSASPYKRSVIDDESGQRVVGRETANQMFRATKRRIPVDPDLAPTSGRGGVDPGILSARSTIHKERVRTWQDDLQDKQRAAQLKANREAAARSRGIGGALRRLLKFIRPI